VYACVSGGDIYKRTGGVGSFAALGQTSRAWNTITAAPNGYIYAGVYNEYIYRQTVPVVGVNDFLEYYSVGGAWSGACSAPNGAIYFANRGGDIYKDNDTGDNFNPLSQTHRDWLSLTSDQYGNIYAAITNYIYIQRAGVGNFTLWDSTAKSWTSICVDIDNNIYAAVYSGDIWKKPLRNINYNLLKPFSLVNSTMQSKIFYIDSYQLTLDIDQYQISLKEYVGDDEID
jgi:hypothetical protein